MDVVDRERSILQGPAQHPEQIAVMRTKDDSRRVELAQGVQEISLGTKSSEQGLLVQPQDVRGLQRRVIWKHRCIDGGVQIGRDERSLEMLGELLSELHAHI